MRILLAIDESPSSEAAVQMVIRQNRPESAEVRVLHIVEPLTALFPPINAATGQYAVPSNWDELQRELVRKGRELAEKAAQKLTGAGFKTDCTCREGIARIDIVDAATEWDADLIVVGSHGRTGLQRVLLGSVSDYVARHAKCSVEIVRLASVPARAPR